MTQLRFALVGCGRIGIRHAEYINHFGILNAVCDIVYENAKRVGDKYNASVYTSFETLLKEEKELDVVSICTPNSLHASQAIMALRAGNHVLCEKPMGINVHECGQMIHEAEKANRRLFIVKQNRFNPPVEAVKKLIDQGELGKIFSVQLNCFWNRNSEYYSSSSWKGTRSMDGGTLYTQFSHFIDLLYYLIGDIKDVAAFTDNFNHKGQIEFEDTGVVACRFYNGVLGAINFTLNSYNKNMEGSLTLFAEKGTIKIGGQYLNELEYQMLDGFEIKDLPVGNPPNQYGNYTGSMSNHEMVYENLVDVLNNGGVIATNGFEGLKTVEIIDKIYACAAKSNKKDS